MNGFRNRRAAVVLAIALVTTAACSKKADDNVVVGDTSMNTMPPVTNALRVDEIEIGKGLDADKSVRDGTDDFGVRDTIYVAVQTDGSGSGTLGAKFTFQDGQTVEETSQNISPTGEAWHEFHMQKSTAWPAGNYKVEVMLNGASAGTKDFSIK
ncbi:MAG: hypothetical protein M3R07_12390 [Gemmatimonadota bacterium]|nr:hypothetical protein [Gemmatimonadota bacterium]